MDSGKNEKVAGCAPQEAQLATFEHDIATGAATENATTPLKTLAHKVLSRNTERNQSATTAENRRNFCAQKKGEKLRLNSRDFDTKILEKACLNLALKPKQLWRCLSEEDIEDIQAGLIDSETLRAYAERWNDHPHLVLIGNDLSFPAPELKDVVCGDCRHFLPDEIGDGTGIGSCANGLIGTKPLYPNAKRICHSFKGKRHD